MQLYVKTSKQKWGTSCDKYYARDNGKLPEGLNLSVSSVVEMETCQNVDHEAQHLKWKLNESLSEQKQSFSKCVLFWKYHLSVMQNCNGKLATATKEQRARSKKNKKYTQDLIN